MRYSFLGGWPLVGHRQRQTAQDQDHARREHQAEPIAEQKRRSGNPEDRLKILDARRARAETARKKYNHNSRPATVTMTPRYTVAHSACIVICMGSCVISQPARGRIATRPATAFHAATGKVPYFSVSSALQM